MNPIDRGFDWVQIQLLNPKVLAWVCISLGVALVGHSLIKIREAHHRDHILSPSR